MTDITIQRRGVTNEGGFFSPYYLYDLMERQHKDELDVDGRNTNRKMLPRVFRAAYARLNAGSTPSEAWNAWYEELFTALGWLPGHIARFEELVPTNRYGQVPISHGGILREGDDAPFAYIDLHGFGVNLDRDQYPSQQKNILLTIEPITRAVEFALDFNATRWAIVSNGAEMRLYRKGGSVARQYLKVDFAALFDVDDAKEWTAFWGLFRRDAFVPGPDGRCLLDRVIEESQRHATRIADDLRENILIALEALIQGILDDPANRPVLGNPAALSHETLQQLFEETLYFLYRLLFVLYAESRDLLPVGENLMYRDTYSFEHLRDLADRPMPDAEGDHTYFIESIRTLLRMLYKGFPDEDMRTKLGKRIPFTIAAYNGQLFNPERTALLDRCRIPDRAMHTVVRELSLSRPRRAADQRERFSYADLGVDQLGSIYEGLLVYEPTVASEPMAVVTIRNEERWITHAQAEEYGLEWDEGQARRPGQFYLRLWGGRRKSSASYYTPQEITSFLVKEALEPLVEPILTGCAERDADGKPKRRPDEILDLKVCDPAMGSGAFLVQACRYLAEAFGRARVAAGEDDDGRVSQAELAHYKRRVAERCLYGVDLNPMAVELAKVSLWLETLAADRPLEFLDAHLRHGNSLIGAPLRDADGKFTIDLLSFVPDAALKEVSKEATAEDKARARKRIALNKENVKVLKQVRAGQLGFADWNTSITQELDRRFQVALTARRNIEKSDETLTQQEAVALVYEKEARYRELRQSPEFQAVQRICDLWCAIWFWPTDSAVEPPTTQAYRELMAGLLGLDFGNSLTADETAAYLAAVEHACDQQNFFHWELEFPEVWREPNGKPKTKAGFDAIVSNPPWEKIEFDTENFFSQFLSVYPILPSQQKKLSQGDLLSDNVIFNEYRVREDTASQISNFMRYGIYQAQVGGRAPDLYRAFVERDLQLLSPQCQAVFVLPGSFYSLDGSTALRKMITGKHRFKFLVSIENRRRIFEIDSRLKIALTSIQKDVDGQDIPSRFFISPGFVPSIQELGEVFSSLKRDFVNIKLSDLYKYSPDKLSLREFQSARDAEIYGKFFALGRLLKYAIEEQLLTQTQSFNRSEFRHHLNEDHSGKPVITGRCIHQFNISYAPPPWWIEEQFIPITGRLQYTMEQFILAYRITARSTDEWTLIGAIVPPTIATDYKLNLVVVDKSEPARLLWLAGWINSLSMNYALRQYHAGTDISQLTLEQLPILDLSNTNDKYFRVCRNAAMLACVVQDFSPLWNSLAEYINLPLWSLNVVPSSDGVRAQLRAEIDAIVADLYGLSEPDFAYILSTFPLLDRSQPALPSEPKSTITRDLALLELFKLRGKTPPDDVVTFFREAGAEIGTITGEIRGLAERVAAASKLGAVAYIPSSRGGEEITEEGEESGNAEEIEEGAVEE